MPNRFISNLKLKLYTLVRIPLIAFVSLRIKSLTDNESVARIPLCYRTKNHVGSMYFGALGIGAEMCVGLLAMHHIAKTGQNIVPIFKDFHADYKKLAKGHVHFICREGEKVKSLVTQAAKDGERHNAAINGFAVVPSINPEEPVMEFTITLSLKRKG